MYFFKDVKSCSMAETCVSGKPTAVLFHPEDDGCRFPRNYVTLHLTAHTEYLIYYETYHFCVVLCTVCFVSFSVLCVCVYVYCTTATGWLPNRS